MLDTIYGTEYKFSDLVAYLGEFIDDYDVPAIDNAVWVWEDGKKVWAVTSDELAFICAHADVKNTTPMYDVSLATVTGWLLSGSLLDGAEGYADDLEGLHVKGETLVVGCCARPGIEPFTFVRRSYRPGEQIEQDELNDFIARGFEVWRVN